MPTFSPKRLVLASCALLATAAGPALAGTETNVMNNIVTLTDSCSLAAIGVDFGVAPFPLPMAGVNAVPLGSANNGTTNAMSGNSGHPYFGKDATDSLSLTSPVSAINGALTTALSAVAGNLTTPGVYVLCTTTPSSLTLTSANGGTAVPLPITVTDAATSVVNFKGTMVGVGAGATGANHLDYTLTLKPAVVSTAVSLPAVPAPVAGAAAPVTGAAAPVTGAAGTVAASVPTVFTGAYPMLTGNIPATQGGSVVVGQYWDGAVATLVY